MAKIFSSPNELDPNEASAEVGDGLMEDGIQMQRTGGGLFKASWMLTGDSFISSFINSGRGRSRVAFGAPHLPGYSARFGAIRAVFVSKDSFVRRSGHRN
jgi:hypothetical protein